MKVLKRQFYISVDSRPDIGVESFCVRISSNLKALLRDWGPTTRISPLWQLRAPIDEPPRTDVEPRSIWFLHGTPADFVWNNFSESQLSKLYHEAMWLSVGAHSVILLCKDDQLDEDIRNICLGGAVCFERWDIDEVDGNGRFWGSEIEYILPEDYFQPDSKPSNGLISKAFSQASVEADEALGFMNLELFALLSVVSGRSHGPFEVLADDALVMQELAYDLISDKEADDDEFIENSEDETDTTELHTSVPKAYPVRGAAKPDILLQLNAALSRMSSQAFSGTSPILRTECHFWPHSLLGTGIANLALRNVAAFITDIAEAVQYDIRLYSLARHEFDVSQYDVCDLGSDFPEFVSIDISEIIDANNIDSLQEGDISLGDEDSGMAVTPITYFSGRDGFMNGAVTTSAPLPSVSGANSYQWNLGTITHEITHRILSGHIFDSFEYFLEEINDMQEAGRTGVQAVKEYFEATPTCFMGYAAKLLGRVLMLRACLNYDESEMRSAMESPFEFFSDAEQVHAEDVEELIVHIFDFYHFYGSDSESYCNFVWLSWAVLPSIEDKLDEYVIRTLVALSVKHISRPDWRELAIADFTSVIDEEPLKSRLHFRIQIINLLADDEKRFEILQYLGIARPLLVLFHMYFKSDRLRLKAAEDLYSNPQKRNLTRDGKKEQRSYHYRFPLDTFVSGDPSVGRPKFTNPLLFLRDYSREEEPSAAQSAWLLHMLAYNLDTERSHVRGGGVS